MPSVLIYHVLTQRWTPDRIDGTVSWFEQAWTRLRNTVPAGAHEKLLEEFPRLQDQHTKLLTKYTASDAECIRLRFQNTDLKNGLIDVDQECSRQKAIADELKTSLKLSENVRTSLKLSENEVMAKDEMIASLEWKISCKDSEIERTRDKHANAIGDLDRLRQKLGDLQLRFDKATSGDSKVRTGSGATGTTTMASQLRTTMSQLRSLMGAAGTENISEAREMLSKARGTSSDDGAMVATIDDLNLVLNEMRAESVRHLWQIIEANSHELSTTKDQLNSVLIALGCPSNVDKALSDIIAARTDFASNREALSQARALVAFLVPELSHASSSDEASQLIAAARARYEAAGRGPPADRETSMEDAGHLASAGNAGHQESGGDAVVDADMEDVGHEASLGIPRQTTHTQIQGHGATTAAPVPEKDEEMEDEPDRKIAHPWSGHKLIQTVEDALTDMFLAKVEQDIQERRRKKAQSSGDAQGPVGMTDAEILEAMNAPGPWDAFDEWLEGGQTA